MSGLIKLSREVRKDVVAAYVHYMWANWCETMLTSMHPANIERWKHIAKLKYPQLTQEDKDFCRTWAEKLLELLEGEIKSGN